MPNVNIVKGSRERDYHNFEDVEALVMLVMLMKTSFIRS